jgi:uncharacterized protein (TIGR03118 family)
MKLKPTLQNSAAATGLALAVAISLARPAEADIVQTNLVSNISGLASINDPELVNPWGVSFTATSPFWISNQGKNTTSLYAVTGANNVSEVPINPPVDFVNIPTTATGPQGPTGQVSNTVSTSFDVGNGGNGSSADFIFANLNGTISAWNGGTTSFVQATTTGASFTGLAVNQMHTLLYAANDAGTGGIDVFNSSFQQTGSLGANAFATPTAISSRGLVPFNVQDINGDVYVTYAPPGQTAQQTAKAGMGAVAVFDENGNLLPGGVLINGGPLAAPWGVALAPSDFGQFSNDLLVANSSFGDSVIDVFNPNSGDFLGTIDINDGDMPGSLRALAFGIGGDNGSPDTLFFTDGIDGENAGLFGALNVVPEPSGLAILGTALGLLAIWRTRRAGLIRRPLRPSASAAG